MRRVLIVLGALITGACTAGLQANLPATLTAQHAAVATAKPATFAIVYADSMSSEAIAIVRNGLEERGMKYAPADAADVVVGLEYSLSGPTWVREWRSEPLYRTYTTPGYTRQQAAGTDKNGRTIYTTVTVAGTSTQQYVGENYYCFAAPMYDKQMLLSARPADRVANSVPGWDVSISVRDDVKDPAKYAVVLARAAVNQVDAAVQVGTPVTLVDGGRKVKARKVYTPAVQDSAVNVPGARYRGPSGVRCGSDSSSQNPVASIRNAVCMSRPINLAYPANGSTTIPIGRQDNLCVPGINARPGDNRWR